MDDALYKYEDEIGRDEARAIDYSLLVFDTAVDHPREAYEASLITQARLRAELAAAESRWDALRGMCERNKPTGSVALDFTGGKIEAYDAVLAKMAELEGTK